MAYEINININGDIEEVNSKGNVAGVSKTADNKEKAQQALAKYISSQTIEPFIQNVKTQITQNVQTVTGNSELQQRINFGFQAVQFGVNTYKNAQSGALVANAAGFSMSTGVLIGIALTAVNAAMQIGFSQYQINLEKRMESYQLRQVRDRQGVAYNKSRS